MKTMRCDLGDDGVLLVTIDVPGQAVNTLNALFFDDFEMLLSRIETTPEILGVIFTSGKSNNFIAGSDIREMIEIHDRGWTPLQVADWAKRAQILFRRLEKCGKPVASAISGAALGGGLELALACHYRLLADAPRCVVGLPEVTLGLLPGAGGTQRLPRLIGIAKALPLILEGRHVAPAEALSLGIVDEVVAADVIVQFARAWIATRPDPRQPWDRDGFRVPGGVGPSAPHAKNSFMTGVAAIRASTGDNWPAPKAILSTVYEGTQLPFDAGAAIEMKYFVSLLAHPVARNMMRTFLNKGAANKLSARPADIPQSRVRRLGMLGAGMMGQGIAQTAAAAGVEVVLLDATRAGALASKARIAGLAEKQVARGRLSSREAEAQLARIFPTEDYADLADCDFIVEAVFEDRAVKAEVITKVDQVASPQIIFASNTSTLAISSLARNVKRPAQFIGMHFFSPVDRMPLVEIIRGRDTGPEALARTLDFARLLKKTPIVVNDGPGFYASRAYCAYVDEAMQMIGEGVAPALIENAAKGAGMAVGPLAAIDETTQDLRWRVVKQARLDQLPARFSEPFGVSTLEAMCEQLDRKGRRFGAGFYDYPAGGKKRLWLGLSEYFPRKKMQPSAQELKQRFLFIQALEAASCLEEGVLEAPADADIGALLGIGFPGWTGGPLSFIDMMGIRPFLAACDKLKDTCGSRFAPSAWLRERAARNESFYRVA